MGNRLKTNAAMLALTMTLFLLPIPAAALKFAGQREALTGLKGVGVEVTPLRPEAERLGLTTGQIKTDVELRLRKAGVRVLTADEVNETTGHPILFITVTPSISSGLCAYMINVQLGEVASLARGNAVYATTWLTNGVGTFWTQDMRKIRGYVGDCIDEFINDYLAANPK
jgi:hypothetical protein